MENQDRKQPYQELTLEQREQITEITEGPGAGVSV